MSSKSSKALIKEVNDLAKESEGLNAMITSIKALCANGEETAKSGKSSCRQVEEEMNAVLKDLVEFKATVDAEVETLGDKDKSVAELKALKTEIKQLHATFKGLINQLVTVKEEIKKEKALHQMLLDEEELWKAKMAAKTEEMKEQEREYKEKEKFFEDQLQAIDDDLARKKQLLEDQLRNPQPNFVFEGGDQTTDSDANV